MKLVRESIEFTRGGDARKAIGIGKIAEIEKWFMKWAPYNDYKIDRDFKITVNGHLDFRETPIEELPKDLYVEGELDLTETAIKELPKGLSVGGDLYLYRTSIKELPPDLKVGGNLFIGGTPIKRLPPDLVVGGTIYKDF